MDTAVQLTAKFVSSKKLKKRSIYLTTEQSLSKFKTSLACFAFACKFIYALK